jgi:hypothetical protein
MLRKTLRTATLRPLQSIRLSSTTSTSASQPTGTTAKAETPEHKAGEGQDKPAKAKKTIAEMDEELRMKMSGLAGDGGEAGIELEGGQPVSMKRSVRENMFRYI